MKADTLYLQDLQTFGDLANGDISNSSTDSSTQATSSQIVSLNSIEVEPFVAEDVSATGSELDGACGLYNLGNTCYMNSALQCLLHNNTLKDYFLTYSINSKLKDESLLSELCELYEKMWSGKWSILVPRNFKMQIELMHSQFSGHGQHDGQEFLALFLASMHQELKKINDAESSGDSAVSSEEKSIKRKRTGSRVDDSMPNNKRMDSCGSNKQFLSITSLLGKEKKTANVNVLNTDVECDEEITTDHSNKFPQAPLHPKSEPSDDILMNNELAQEKKSPDGTVFLEQIKDLKLRQLKGLNCKQTNVLADIKRHEKECLVSSLSQMGCKSVTNLNVEQEFSDTVEIMDDCCTGTSSSVEKSPDCLSYGDALLCKTFQPNYKTDVANSKNKLELNDDVDETEHDSAPCRTTSPETIDQNDDLLDTASNIRGDICGVSSTSSSAYLAEEMWQKYVEQNKSIVVDTLQGQMESTVVCCKCSHKSTTYEPFMYLSVPIPHALQRLYTVRIVPLEGATTSHSIYVMKEARVEALMEKLSIAMAEKRKQFDIASYVLCEVKNWRILKVLESTSLLKTTNTTSRHLEAIEFLNKVQSEGKEKADVKSAWNSCSICLEELSDCGLLKHQLESCSALMCHTCLQNSTEHYGLDDFACPFCHMKCCPATDFLPLASSSQSRDVVLSVNFTFLRGNTVEFLSSSRLMRISSSLSAKHLYAFAQELIPKEFCHLDYKLIFSTLDGASCSRCDVTSSCSGCVTVAVEHDDIALQPGDNIAVRFTEFPYKKMATPTEEVASKNESPVTLEMCLSAFTQKEILDNTNPWFCPSCQCHQMAEKKLRICRWPKTLIVYIKRFLYHSKSAVKVDDEVIFPIEDFDPGFISGTDAAFSKLYDLNSIVSHYGGVYSGHYTSCCKRSTNEKWYLCNDEKVSYHDPSRKDAAAVYILFYEEKTAATTNF